MKKRNLKIINKNYGLLLMLLLYALGLANIGYNIIKNWKIKENRYSVKTSDHKSGSTLTGLKRPCAMDGLSFHYH